MKTARPDFYCLKSYATMRLNQFLAHAGLCARRKADVLILAHQIKVNGHTISQLGYRIVPGDVVTYLGQVLHIQKKEYWLLNKPLNTLSTLYDPQGRATVIELLGKGRQHNRIYPVGRLDRNTTGLLLLTNDGALARALSHPASEVPKVYEAVLEKEVRPEHITQLTQGIYLRDGIARADEAAVLDKQGKILRIVLHSGRNRIIRRMLDALGYHVLALDRVGYAHLTKGTLEPGAWRALSEREIAHLQALSKRYRHL